MTGGARSKRWFAGLDAPAAAKVAVALARLEQGNLSNAKGVGEGVLEYRIDWGPGYRVYFGRDGDDAGDPADGRDQASASSATSRRAKRILDGLQAATKPRGAMNGGERWH